MVGAPTKSILEVGANVGSNLHALRGLIGAELFAVEPNERARDILIRDGAAPPATSGPGEWRGLRRLGLPSPWRCKPRNGSDSEEQEEADWVLEEVRV